MHVRPDDGDVTIALEGRRAGEQLVEDAPERVDVRAMVWVRARLDLLGGDVVDGADELTGLRQPALRAGVPREAEVGEVAVVAPAALDDEHIPRLDVSV